MKMNYLMVLIMAGSYCTIDLSHAQPAQIGGYLQGFLGSDIPYLGAGVPNDLLRVFQAAELCKKKGARLPTAREFAQAAEQYQGKILEVEEYNKGNFPPGYRKEDFSKISAINSNSIRDVFYYSSSRYPYQSNAHKSTVWTSSELPMVPGDDYQGRYYVFHAQSGRLFYQFYSGTSAARCAIP